MINIEVLNHRCLIQIDLFHEIEAVLLTHFIGHVNDETVVTGFLGLPFEMEWGGASTGDSDILRIGINLFPIVLIFIPSVNVDLVVCINLSIIICTAFQIYLDVTVFNGPVIVKPFI